MKRHLSPPRGVDAEFYVKGTADALNKYMEELEGMFGRHTFKVNGTVTIPSTPPVTVQVNNTPAAYFVPNKLRFTAEEVKNAMWCQEPRMCFINLFNLIGKKICDNFTRVSASPFISGQMGFTASVPTSFATCGAAFSAALFAMGSKCTPETVLRLESNYIQTAMKQVIFAPVPLAGACVLGGLFTGTAEVNFENAT